MKSITKRGGLIVLFTGLSSLLSFLFQIILAREYGAFYTLDAYFGALTLPTIITTLLSVTFSAALLPPFVKLLAEKKNDQAAASSTFTYVSLFCLGLVVLGELLAPQIIRATLQFTNYQETLLAITYFRILTPIIFFNAAVFVFTAFYLALDSYVLPSLSMVVSNIFVILFYFLAKPTLGIWSFAWAITLSTVVQMLFLLPLMIKKGYTEFNLSRTPYLTTIIAVSIPLFLGGLLYRSNNLVDRFFASGLGEGKITYLNYGYKMVSTLAFVLISGIQTIGFAKFSESFARSNPTLLDKQLKKALLIGCLLLVPSALITYFFASQIIGLFLGHGSFSLEASKQTALALKYYSPAIVSMALSGLVASALYALNRSRTVVIINILGMVLFILLSAILLKTTDYLGLALSFTVVNYLQLVAYLLFYKLYSKKLV